MNNSLNRKGLKLAIAREELDMFLMGIGMYRIGYNPYAPGNSMISRDIAMGEIYAYYRDEPEAQVDKELEKTIFRFMGWKSGIGVYAAFSIISYQLKMEEEWRAPFKIDQEKLISELRKVAIKYESKLKMTKEYEGEGLEEGLWQAMMMENERNIKDYDIHIL